MLRLQTRIKYGDMANVLGFATRVLFARVLLCAKWFSKVPYLHHAAQSAHVVMSGVRPTGAFSGVRECTRSLR
eukprot:10552130-Alexandrium_andersonii.AAC.1